MFGYVTANCIALTQQQLERYRGCYCGLCRRIYEKYGTVARLAVSYDMTFLILLLTALTEAEEKSERKRCPTHPFKCQPSWDSPWTDYGADLSVLLMWHNLDDACKDGHKLLGGGGRALFQKAYEKAAAARPRESGIIARAMERLWEIEGQDPDDRDAAAAVFGDMLGELFAVDAGRWTESLRGLGNYLGRYIYMTDAVCDIKKDLRSGNYNPLKRAYEAGERDFVPMLSMLMAECTAFFEVLPIVQDAAILRNILYSGVWLKLSDTQKTRKEGK